MTTDDKLRCLLSAGFDDNFYTSSLAIKLNSSEIHSLVAAVKSIVDFRIRCICDRLNKLPRQRDRLAEISRLAAETAEEVKPT